MTGLRLAGELEGQFIKVIDENSWRDVDAIGDADGVIFLCPKCYQDNGGSVGTHSVLCWSPKVPLTITPVPGRWNLTGTGLSDLTLVAGSSSVLLTSGCQAHFFVRNGEIVGC